MGATAEGAGMRTVEDMQVELERWQARCLKAEQELKQSQETIAALQEELSVAQERSW